MSQKAHYIRIGFFVVLAIALAVAGVVVFGAGHLFEATTLVETYFDKSLQGLEIGSDVKHRGVKIGRVKEIGFVHDSYPLDFSNPEQRKASRYVRVVFAVRNRKPEGPSRSHVLDLVKYGLRIRANPQGITGTLLLETDYADSGRPLEDLPIFWTPEHFYIPSMPNTLTELTTSMQGVFERLNKLEIEKSIEQFNATLKSIETAVTDAKVGELSTQIQRLAENATASSERLNKILESDHVKGAVSNAHVTLANVAVATAQVTNEVPVLFKRVEVLARTVDRTVAEQNDRLSDVLLGASKLIVNVNELIDEIKAAPSLLLFGQSAADSVER